MRATLGFEQEVMKEGTPAISWDKTEGKKGITWLTIWLKCCSLRYLKRCRN